MVIAQEQSQAQTHLASSFAPRVLMEVGQPSTEESLSKYQAFSLKRGNLRLIQTKLINAKTNHNK